MLPPERRLPGVRDLIGQEHYFVIHAPRQVGKTTCFDTLARQLTVEGCYAAVLTSCEAGQLLSPDLEGSIAAILHSLRQDAEEFLPEELRPPAIDSEVSAAARFRDLLVRWARQCPRPVVLFLDEIDALVDDGLISILRQLRSGYRARPQGFPQSVALIGLRDVRDYRLDVRPEGRSLGTSSPFNIKVESLRLRNFNAEEVAELYAQHTAETGQVFTPEASALAFDLTGGHPWLVNALARESVEKLAPDQAVPITPEIITAAKEALIQRRDTHLDSLIDRLRESRVRRVIEPILAGELLPPEVMEDDLQFVQDLGLVTATPHGLAIANPIYREVIPRALTTVLQQSVSIPRTSYINEAGGLRFDQLLDDFRTFWCENASDLLSRSPYSEAAAQLVFMAFLHKIVNGGGFIDREFAVGSGRVDLCVRWPYPGGVQRWAAELKVWRDGRPDPLAEGLAQLSGYLARLGLDQGTLLLFDQRTKVALLPERCTREELEHEGRRITMLRL
jgi:hypothetical protein